jgi:hypothetical protein
MNYKPIQLFVENDEQISEILFTEKQLENCDSELFQQCTHKASICGGNHPIFPERFVFFSY